MENAFLLWKGKTKIRPTKLFSKNGRKSVYQKIKTLNDLKPNQRSKTYALYNTSFISEIIFGSHNFMTASA